jgi:thiol-disulfide isomerase/thioredoxin
MNYGPFPYVKFFKSPKVFIKRLNGLTLAISATYETTYYPFYTTYWFPACFRANEFFAKVYKKDVF